MKRPVIAAILLLGVSPLWAAQTGPLNRPDDPRYLDGWRMAGANPQRTGWVPQDVPGRLRLEWYRPFEPHISAKVQLVAADGLIFVASARGLYALDAETGEQKWVYATDVPLGHSPTVIDGVAYVGSFDRRIHAVDATTGKGIWTSDPAGAGFNTNPVVEGGRVFAGNRDGSFYAFDARSGRLLWTFTTELQQPILFSPAYKDGTLYFGCNDGHAYALSASDGKLLWKSPKLPGAGFHSYWPVVHGQRVIFTTGSHYVREPGLPSTGLDVLTSEQDDVYGRDVKTRRGNAGASVSKDAGAPWNGLDLSRKSPEGNGPVTEYYRAKPWRRTYFVLDRRNGQEVTYDFAGDGTQYYAPLLYHGTHSGNRTPAVVGGDGLLYQMAGGAQGGGWIARGGIAAWLTDTPIIGFIHNEAHDEPTAISAGGNQIYFCHGEGYDGEVGSADIVTRRSTSYYWGIDKVARNIMPWRRDRPHDMYGHSGDQNPPIPYRGRLYLNRWGHVLCFSANGGVRRLEVSKTMPPTAAPAPLPTRDELRRRLAGEIEKMLKAGHLRPGWFNNGLRSHYLSQSYTDKFGDYFRYPGDTIVTLLAALPHLPPELQQPLKDYVRAEFEAYPPDRYAHIGWDGAAREALDLPPEIIEGMKKMEKPATGSMKLWRFPPQANYALYQYAKAFGNAEALVSRLRPIAVPADDVLTATPFVHNAYIAGLAGTVGLLELAGRPDAAARAELNRLMALRVKHFNKLRPPREEGYDGVLKNQGSFDTLFTVARNFMFLTPELAARLGNDIPDKVREAWSEYNEELPYWFVAKSEEGDGENVFNPLFNYHAMFQAKAMILRAPYAELVKYLDVPAFWRGDLYYIDNLMAALEAR